MKEPREAEGRAALGVGSSPSGGELAEDERRWLGYQISRAAEKAFPPTHRIGKTRQQDFYFRELLEVLIDNTFRDGVPITGGTYAEIWQFTRDRVSKWRTQPGAQRGRSGYRRESIKTLIHEWRTKFRKRSRSIAGNGTIGFVLDTSGPESDDLVLRAVVSDLKLQNGATFRYHESELSQSTRLGAPSEVDPAGKAEEKQRLIVEARKYVRRVEAGYLAKLAEAPLEFVEQEIAELRRARRDYRRLAAAVLVVVGTAMAGYKVLHTPRVTAVLDISPGSRGGFKNVVVDRAGHIALADSGKRTSNWADVITDGKGGFARVERLTPDGAEVVLQTDRFRFDFRIPDRWHQQPEVILKRETSCTRRFNQDRDILCLMLVDVREIYPHATADGIRFGANWGDDEIVHAARSDRINAMRVVVTAEHTFAKDGSYDVTLFASTDSTIREAEKSRGTASISINEKTTRVSPIGRFAINGQGFQIESAPLSPRFRP